MSGSIAGESGAAEFGGCNVVATGGLPLLSALMRLELSAIGVEGPEARRPVVLIPTSPVREGPMMVVVYLRLEAPANLGSSEWARLIWCRRLTALAVAGVSRIDGGGFGVAGMVR